MKIALSLLACGIWIIGLGAASLAAETATDSGWRDAFETVLMVFLIAPAVFGAFLLIDLGSSGKPDVLLDDELDGLYPYQREQINRIRDRLR